MWVRLFLGGGAFPPPQHFFIQYFENVSMGDEFSFTPIGNVGGIDLSGNSVPPWIISNTMCRFSFSSIGLAIAGISIISISLMWDVYSGLSNKIIISWNISEFVFLVAYLINHGRQNPIEPSRYGCQIFHGPYVRNFSEVYSFLYKQNTYRLLLLYHKLYDHRKPLG